MIFGTMVGVGALVAIILGVTRVIGGAWGVLRLPGCGAHGVTLLVCSRGVPAVAMAISALTRLHRSWIQIHAALTLWLILLSAAPGLSAQEVRGQLLSEAENAPIEQALILLLDESGRETARTIATPSGGFELRTPAAGRYRLRVQRIGQRGWEAPPFDLTAGQISRITLHVPDVPFELGELEAVAQRPRCGVTLGDASLGARVLEAAQTALGLAEAEATSGRRTYVLESYNRTVPERGATRDSVLTRGQLTGWPIQSADPDSLRINGFVHGEWPAGRFANPTSIVGPTYFAPDARVLFTEWFLSSHCIVLDTTSRQSGKAGRLVARFEPAKGTRSSGGLKGDLIFDRRTLNLRVLTFEFAELPSWAPRGSAGGELRFARLPDGAWVPASWQLRAPMPKVGSDRYHFFGVMELGGRVTSVRGENRQPDPAAEAAIKQAIEF